jgi:putative sigma-54 modulation protein
VKNGHRVEIVTNVKGTTIICKDESPDMYSSIDAVAAALNRKLCKYKERRTAGWHGGSNMGADLAAALEAIEENVVEETTTNDSNTDPSFDDYDDPARPDIMKVNSFQLDKPISVQEAIFALDYVDHDFYVFTNDATNKINVVYKRHTGGIGHVEP